ncbi:MAG: ATP-binding cassette domain-containing protein [Lactobacillaceae bacterium]|jgi:putative ABC transport system ATP-binding protein|nr:ATP-binding cassette domain-containing protein [Lactobacillaceae bacterium]
MKIEIINVSKVYKNKLIFDNLNTQFLDNQIIGIKGASGIGKSTFFDIISGLKTIDSGEIYFENQRIDNLSETDFAKFRGKHIAYATQDTLLIDDWLVKENLNVIQDINEEKMEKLMEIFSISDLYKKKISKLSGGQKQRINLIRALVKESKILILDEPTNNLDQINIDVLKRILLKEKSPNKIILIASHDDKFLEIVDQIFEVNKNQLIELTQI